MLPREAGANTGKESAMAQVIRILNDTATGVRYLAVLAELLRVALEKVDGTLVVESTELVDLVGRVSLRPPARECGPLPWPPALNECHLRDFNSMPGRLSMNELVAVADLIERLCKAMNRELGDPIIPR